MTYMQTDLIGVVLSGGQSKRMHADKAFLNYRDLPQYQYLFHLLQKHCHKTLISANQHQIFELPSITDAEVYQNFGPPAAWLTIYDHYPSAIVVIGVDYPYFDEKELQHLINERDRTCCASVLYNPTTGFYEPMLGIYEQSFFKLLIDAKSTQPISIQNILRNNPTKKVIPLNTSSIQSVDTMDEYEKVKSILHGKQ
jgi:molybdenum cofactor guanylyltransferase